MARSYKSERTDLKQRKRYDKNRYDKPRKVQPRDGLWTLEGVAKVYGWDVIEVES